MNFEPPNWATTSGSGAATNGKPEQVVLRIICKKCGAENPTAIRRCQKCDTDLLSYRSVLDRFIYFGVSIIISLIAIWIGYQSYQQPEKYQFISDLDLTWYVVGFAVLTPFFGLAFAFGKGKVFENFKERAQKHAPTYPYQALSDYSHALVLAPANEHTGLLKARLKLYSTLGLAENATRDELALTYAKENNPQGGVGLFLGEKLVAGSFGDSFQYGWMRSKIKEARRERMKLYEAGKVIALGYCKTCREVVTLDAKLRCPGASEKGAKRHFSKPKIVQFVVPNDRQAGVEQVLKLVKKDKGKWVAWVKNITILVISYFLLRYAFEILQR